MKRKLQNLVLSLAGALMLVPFAQAAVNTAQPKQGLTGLEQDVRHELVMLPWFGVFDNLEFQVNGSTVVLSGQVNRPTLQKDAERAVSRIEGIEKVINNIEVLPLSPFDDRIRVAAYRQSTALDRCPGTAGDLNRRFASSSRTRVTLRSAGS